MFDEQNARDIMSEKGNSLERLSKVVYFEIFRPLLEEKLTPKVSKYQGDTRAWGYVMMFMQRLFGLSDKQVQ